MLCEEYGKVNYSVISLPNKGCVWCYSYLELQNKLNDLVKNHILKKVYVSLSGYLDSETRPKDNYYSFSDFGGPVILFFDNTAIELYVHATGMVEYCTIELKEIVIENKRDFPPDDMKRINNLYFYDLSKQFKKIYEEQLVINIVVDNIDAYPFSFRDFDEEKAEESMASNCLPNNIHFQLANGVDFGIYASDIEWFFIELM